MISNNAKPDKTCASTKTTTRHVTSSSHIPHHGLCLVAEGLWGAPAKSASPPPWVLLYVHSLTTTRSKNEKDDDGCCLQDSSLNKYFGKVKILSFWFLLLGGMIRMSQFTKIASLRSNRLSSLTHVGDDNMPKMVDVNGKIPSKRTAHAQVRNIFWPDFFHASQSSP